MPAPRNPTSVNVCPTAKAKIAETMDVEAAADPVKDVTAQTMPCATRDNA